MLLRAQFLLLEALSRGDEFLHFSYRCCCCCCWHQTVGNHEFDFGTQLLGSYIKNLSAPMLGACNVDASDEPALKGLLKKFIVLKHGNFKVSPAAAVPQSTSTLLLLD
jgi:hypothetical protein